MITTPVPSRLNVTMVGVMFGAMCRAMIRQPRVPARLAATMNGSPRIVSVAPRVIRPTVGMPNTDSAQITCISLGPSPSEITSASTRAGNAIRMSSTRESTASTQPPK